MSWITSGTTLRVILAVSGIAVLAMTPGSGAETPGDARSLGLYPTSAETRAEFEALCHRLKSGSDPYFGRLIVDRLEQRLAMEKVVQEAGEASPHGAETRIGVRGRLAEELLRLGDPGRAVELLAEARGIAGSAGLERTLGDRLSWFLGLAYMQLAEDRNCVGGTHDPSSGEHGSGPRHHPASCILPFTEEALHQLPDPARRAGDHFLEVLSRRPKDIQARWLLNLMRMVTGDYPEGVPESLRLPDGALSPEAPFTPWRDRAEDLGVARFDLAGGAVIDDFDGDGLLDLLTSSWDLCEPLKAFRNTGRRADGTGGFVDVTEAWGLDGQLGGINLMQVDYDGDGRLDIFVLRGGWMGDNGRVRNSLLRNELGDEAGRFVDVTAAVGLAYPAYPTQAAAWADVDGDGDLDLYVGNESASDQVYSWNLVENPGRPFPSQLFLSQTTAGSSDGRSRVTFTDVARAAGVANLRFAKGVAWGDYDDDGDPDLYVSNFGANRLFRNDGGEGRPLVFTDVAPRLGVTAPESASFSSWFFDYDNDGDLDLFVTAYGARIHRVSASYLGLGKKGEDGHPMLYRNDGGTFRDVSIAAGFDRPLLPMGANYGDLDSDGWLDLVLGTGVPDIEALMPDAVYRNDAGRGFADVTFASGLAHLQKGHGVAFGDLDNDGDEDLLHQMGGAFLSDGFANALYENPAAGARWLTLSLEGRRANRFGVGGRIEVVVETAGGRRSIHRLVGSGGSFGASSLQQEIGLGDARAIVAVHVRWPGSGLVQHFDSVELDRSYRVIEGEPELVAIERPRFTFGG